MLEKTNTERISIKDTVNTLLGKDDLKPSTKISELISVDVFVDNVLEFLRDSLTSTQVTKSLENELRAYWYKLGNTEVRDYLLTITTFDPQLMYNVNIAMGGGHHKVSKFIVNLVDRYEAVILAPRDLLQNKLQSFTETAYQVLKDKVEINTVYEPDLALLEISQYYGEYYVDGGHFINTVSRWYTSNETLTPEQVDDLRDEIDIEWVSSSDNC